MAISRALPHKPYRLLGREIKSRLQQRSQPRKAFADALGVDPNHIHAILVGLRSLPDAKIDAAAKFLLAPGEDLQGLKNRLVRLGEPGISRVHLLQDSIGDAVLLGYVDWPPFVMSRGLGDASPQGLLIELVNLLFRLIGINVSWRRLDFKQMLGDLSDGEVDAVMSFVLDTLKRKTRARFLPLRMPFSVGINAVTRSNEFDGDEEYDKALGKLQRGTKRPKKSDPLSVVVVGSEIAHDYLAAIAPEVTAPIEEEGPIVETIRRFTATPHYVVFADSVSCELALRQDRNLKQVFDHPIGAFEGGFLFPMGDPEWEAFFGEAFGHLLKAKLPETGRIFARYADDLQTFLDKEKLQTWLDECWPRQIAIPQSWDQKEKKTDAQ